MIAGLIVLLLVVASPSHGQTGYQIVDAGWSGKQSALQKKLDEAAAAGHQVVRGFERLIIVRQGPAGERRAYTTAGKGSAELLERQMNTAGASGFRLVPQAVLSSHLIAVMQKDPRVGIPAARIGYKLLSFTADYHVSDVGHGLAVSGGFDAGEIDTQLSEMAVAGYRLVAVVARTLSERTVREPTIGGAVGKILGKGVGVVAVEKHHVRQELIVFFEKDTAVAATAVRAAARRYHVITGESESAFEAQLNQAAAAGYGLLAVADHAFPAPIAIVERLEPTASQPRYRVLAPRALSGLQDALAQAAAGGWIPHPRGVADPSGGRHDLNEVMLVLQRQPAAGGTDTLVLSTVRTSTLARELNEASAAGFELAAGGRARGEVVLLLTRTVSTP